jgi:SSS family solute:Na+ symporter
MHVHPIDWAILAVGFLFYLAWAIYLNGKCRSVDDYLVSGRKVRMWLGIGAGIAGELGLVTIAAMCEQGYQHGYSFVLINLLSLSIVVPLFGVFGFGIERFRATRCTSVPEYIEMRYTRNLRIAVGIINCVAGVLMMCIFPIGGAIFLRQLLGAPPATEIFGSAINTDVLIMIVLLVCPLIFTTLGGYTTLIVTNYFQGVFVVFVMAWLLVHVISHAQQPPNFATGLQTTWTGLEDHLQEAGVNPFADSHDAYGVQWFLFLNLMTILLQFSYGPYLQQYASMDRPKTVSRSYLLSGIFGFGRSLIIFGLGVATVAVIGRSQPVPGKFTEVEWINFATPYYLNQIGMPVVLTGLVLLGLLFADVAVTDKYILSWATSIVNDCIQPFRRQQFTPRQQIRAVRLTVAALCVVFFLFGLVYKPGMTIWSFTWLLANLIGGSGIVVVLGMYWPGAKTIGAYVCIAVCVVVPLCDVVARQIIAHIGAKELPWTPEQTGLYTYLAGAALMILCSWCSREESKYWDLGKAVREQNLAPQG